MSSAAIPQCTPPKRATGSDPPLPAQYPRVVRVECIDVAGFLAGEQGRRFPSCPWRLITDAPKSKSGPFSFGQFGPARCPQAMLKASFAVPWKCQRIAPSSRAMATMASDISVAGRRCSRRCRHRARRVSRRWRAWSKPAHLTAPTSARPGCSCRSAWHPRSCGAVHRISPVTASRARTAP